ncbi:hypothetical protein LINGRAHAP2_LOCUS27794, partial [Linum grandiflorum]
MSYLRRRTPIATLQAPTYKFATSMATSAFAGQPSSSMMLAPCSSTSLMPPSCRCCLLLHLHFVATTVRIAIYFLRSVVGFPCQLTALNDNGIPSPIGSPSEQEIAAAIGIGDSIGEDGCQ